MTPDEVAEIFSTATAECGSVTSKPTFTDIDRFNEKVNSMLVELPRDHDGDEHGLLYLSQDASKHNAIAGSRLSKIGTLDAYNSSIDPQASETEHKKSEAVWKVKVNDSKVESAAERGAKKMLLAVFKDTCTNKLKHLIKLCAGVSYFKLI